MKGFRAAILGLLLLAGGALVAAPSAGGFPLARVAHAQTTTPAEAPAENNDLFASAWGCVSNPGMCLLESTLTPVGAIAFLFLALANIVLGLVAGIFDFAVNVLVLQFAVYFGNSEGMLLGWSMLRDLANILLVFGFVSIGLQTILNVGHYSVGKTLPRLIIFAVLLNFSLFAAEAVIDTSNAIAAATFQQAFDCGGAGGCDGSFISAKIMQLTGLSSLTDIWGEFANFTGNSGKFERIIAIILTTVFVFVTASVLLFGGLMLGARAITLAFLMITSPIGFAGMAIPQLNKMANDWWKALINNALFAPAMLLLMFVSLSIVEGVARALPGTGTGEIPNVFDVFTNATLTQSFGGALVFVLVIGFMFGSLMAAKQFGVFGSEWAVKSAGAAIGYSTAGLWARAGRFGLGRPMNAMATRVRASRFGNTLAGDVLAKGLDYGAKGTFDIRGAKGNIKVAGVSLGKVGDFSKEGRRGELKKIAERASKDAELREKAFKAADDPLKTEITRLGTAAETERAKADALEVSAERSLASAESAEQRGDTAMASVFRGQAAELKAKAVEHREQAKKLDNDQKFAKDKLKMQQRDRLTDDEQVLQQYKDRGGKAVDMKRENDEEIAKNTAAVKSAQEEMTQLTAAIAKMESDLRGGFVRPDNEAAVRDQIAAATAQLADAKSRRDAASEAIGDFAHIFNKTERKRREDAYKKKRDGFNKRVNDTRTEEHKQGGKMLESKYAMTQVANRLDNAARGLERAAGVLAAPISDSMRTMARGISTDAGQSKLEKLLHGVQHEIEHAQHAGGHDEGGHDEGGGGHAAGGHDVGGHAGGGHAGGGHAGGGHAGGH